MIPDFKGHHFLEDTKPGDPPSWHHCERCGMKAVLRPDGSMYFDVDRDGVVIKIDESVTLNASVVPSCE